MWTKVWLLAGRASDVPEPGDWLTFEIGPESILVVRQRDGSLAARHNVCMHRGNRLCEPGRGHARRFTCGFHGWSYGIDGRLLGVLDPQSFPQGCDGLDLRPVRCETWAGFVFVCLDPEAEPLRDYLGIVPEHLDVYRFEEWKVAYDATIEIECNWKTSVDAFNEAYHLSATHGWTLEFSDDVNTRYDCYDRHTRMIFPEVQASPRHAGAGTVTPGIRDLFLSRVGVDGERFQGGPAEARAAYAEAIRGMAPALGCDLSKLSESQLCDDYHYTVFPNLTFNTHSLFTWVFTHRPHPDDPNRMFFDFIALLNAPGQEVPRPQKQHFRTADGDTLAGRCEGGDLLDEDLYNLPRIQAGMRSRAFESLHLGDQEVRIRHFHHTLEEYLSR
jgi:phenylpropionate dioxygenase-like ring-hydroxylating dioxygenase large terminal subunit